MHHAERLDGLCSDLPCLVLRDPKFGVWNGYVAVPPGHPWHGHDVDNIPARAVEITYADKAYQRISPRDAHEGWWVLGFDMGHIHDPESTSDASIALQRCEALAKEAARATVINFPSEAAEALPSTALAQTIEQDTPLVPLQARVLDIMARVLDSLGLVPVASGTGATLGSYWARFATQHQALDAADALHSRHGLECKTDDGCTVHVTL